MEERLARTLGRPGLCCKGAFAPSSISSIEPVVPAIIQSEHRLSDLTVAPCIGRTCLQDVGNVRHTKYLHQPLAQHITTINRPISRHVPYHRQLSIPPWSSTKVHKVTPDGTLVFSFLLATWLLTSQDNVESGRCDISRLPHVIRVPFNQRKVRVAFPAELPP